MKSIFAMSAIVVTFFGVQANADWQCTMSCGSKGQEQKIGRGWDRESARAEAQSQICTKYEGGNPKYDRGCVSLGENTYDPGNHGNNGHHGNQGNDGNNGGGYIVPDTHDGNGQDQHGIGGIGGGYDNGHNGGGHHGGGHHGGGYKKPSELWECSFSCGSKGQERKVSQGRDPNEARYNAQYQICTKYEGGYPKYFQGCKRLQ